MNPEAITKAERETLEALLNEGERMYAILGFTFKRVLNEEERRLMQMYLMDPTVIR